MAILASSCRGRNEAKERVAAEREKWESSLPDSLKAIEHRTDSLRQAIEMLGEQMEAELPRFDYVDNPREVEGYYIAKGWKNSYPLQQTGLRARLTKGEKLELIATLAGGAHFNRLRVSTEKGSAETSVVPHDQALNYRMAGLNSVCFCDSAAEACARMIADADGAVRLSYLQGDRETGKAVYSAADKALMAETWRLYSIRKEMTHDERLLPFLAKKGALISAKIEATEGKQK